MRRGGSRKNITRSLQPKNLMTTNSNRIVKLSAAIMSMALLLSATTRAQERRLLRGHVPKAATMLEPIDRLAASNHLKLAVGLPLRNEGALQNLLRQQY